MKNLIGPLDTKKKSNDRGVQRSVQEFWISSSARSVHHMKSMQNVLCFFCFWHITKNEAMSTHSTVNGTAARSTFRNFTSENRCLFSLVLKTFKRFRATALGTQDKNRTSNGTGVLQQVLNKSLTALGLQAFFFEARKIEASQQIRREQRDRQMDANVRAKKKMLKSLQTCDNSYAARSKSVIRVTKKNEISRGEFFEATRCSKNR